MEIRHVVSRTGVSAKTIRYYESIGVLPPPERKLNGYRVYNEADVERIRFVAGVRSLGFSLDDIAEIMALRDRREAPCRFVLDLIDKKAEDIARRITVFVRMEKELRQLYQLGQTFPLDDVDGKACVCHLVSDRSGFRAYSFDGKIFQ